MNEEAYKTLLKTSSSVSYDMQKPKKAKVIK